MNTDYYQQFNFLVETRDRTPMLLIKNGHQIIGTVYYGEESRSEVPGFYRSVVEYFPFFDGILSKGHTMRGHYQYSDQPHQHTKPIGVQLYRENEESPDIVISLNNGRPTSVQARMVKPTQYPPMPPLPAWSYIRKSGPLQIGHRTVFYRLFRMFWPF